MRTAPLRSLLGLVAILAMAAVLIAFIGLLGAAPAVLAFALLCCGQYPGAARIDRAIDARRAARPHRRSGAAPALPHPVIALVSRGGELIADSLAKRPPPRLGLPV